MALPLGTHTPMLGFIGRLHDQNGVDLIRENLNWQTQLLHSAASAFACGSSHSMLGFGGVDHQKGIDLIHIN